MNRLLFATIVFLVSVTSTTNADTISIAATDRGHYLDDGSHNSSNLNYIVGQSTTTVFGFTITHFYHNFFVFDLSGVTEEIVSAQLSLFVPANVGYVSADATETYEVYDVSTSIAALVGGSVGDPVGLSAYNDLGSGISYGSYTASNSDQGTNILLTLNSAGLSALNSTSGLFAIGGALTTLDAAPNTEAVFSSSNSGVLSETQLILQTVQTVPEPSSLVLLATGVIGLIGYRRRQRRQPAQRNQIVKQSET